MQTSDFDFELPSELIAQVPAVERDQSRLLVLHRNSGHVEHHMFRDLASYFSAGDVLVLNNSKVIPARLRGVNRRSGGQFEMLLLEEKGPNDWWVMLRPGKRGRIGTQILLKDLRGDFAGIDATVVETNEEGHRRLRFTGVANIADVLERLGEVPLPPYIQRVDAGRTELDRTRYQTVYAQPPGSVAAPTAGLHFTEAVLNQLRSRGVRVCFLTLHVGLGTFAPVKTENLAGHVMHEERYQVSESTAKDLNYAKRKGRRVIAVGTTSVRVLETIGAEKGGALLPGCGTTRIFIHPPYRFKIVDILLTNFHLPRSTLLMLVSAFAAPGETRGRDLVLSAYAGAIAQRYRFFSYGDAMLVV
jgi:S-adenosylmethionine:tRNA ribosyltransferase-isomerase